MATEEQNIQRLRELTRDPVAYREEQRRQDREAKRRQVESRKAYAEKVYAEHDAHNKASRRERLDAERERIEQRLLRKHLAFGGTPESFEARRAELVAEQQQRQAQQAEDQTVAQARHRVARAI